MSDFPRDFTSSIYPTVWEPSDWGFKGLTEPSEQAGSTQLMGSGRVYFQKVKLIPGDPITRVAMTIQSNGAGLVVGQNYMGICHEDGSGVISTADLTSDWAGGSLFTWRAYDLASTFLPTSDSAWILFLCNGATPISIGRMINNIATCNGILPTSTPAQIQKLLAARSAATSWTSLPASFSFATDVITDGTRYIMGAA